MAVTTCCRRVRRVEGEVMGDRSKRFADVFLFMSPQVDTYFRLLVTTLVKRKKHFFSSHLSSKTVFQQILMVWFHSFTFFVRIVWRGSWKVHLADNHPDNKCWKNFCNIFKIFFPFTWYRLTRISLQL